MLLSGEEDSGKISNEIAVKLATVYNTKAELRKMGYLPKSQVPKTPKEIPPSIASSPPPATPPKATPAPPSVGSPGEVHREQAPIVSRNAGPGSLTGKEGSSLGEENAEGETYTVVTKRAQHVEGESLPSTRDDMQRILFLEASPILKKVALNPKVYLWFDYAKTELGFKGDVGDFLIDTVEDFFRSRGYKIVISQSKEVGY